jgi:hypothetical protein
VGITSRHACSWPWKVAIFAALSGLVLSWTGSAAAAVSDVTFADVTTRAFSVVWASDEPVSGATVRVFADQDGLTEVTVGLTVTLASAGFPPALNLGVVKVDVSGLDAGACVFVQTETTASSTVLEPPAPPFLEVCTAAETAKANALDEPIANDLIRHELFGPDGLTPAAGALLLLSAPGVGAHPLSAFAGDGFALPTAVADLNNLFDTSTGSSAELAGGELLQITEFRGLTCPGLVHHRLLRFRRTPPHEEEATLGRRITEIEAPEPCFFADTVCDDTVNILDAQRVLNIFGSASGACEFNPDLDVVPDGTIDILDVQSVLSRFGESAPFGP